MNSVNKTLYIPLYGKAYVSARGLFINDKKAEEIWAEEGFSLKGKAKSKWLAYYMGVRAAVFDEWLRARMAEEPDAVVIHIGCGMDSRVIRVGEKSRKWYDVDFPDVIPERKRYYSESDGYKMIAGDVRDCGWLADIPENETAIIVMEGVSMYLTVDEMRRLADGLGARFKKIMMLVDAYTSLAVKMSKMRNPVKDVGVTEVYGIDDPREHESEGISFVAEHTMIPQKYIDELKGFERFIFAKLYAGGFSKKLYRLFEYRSKQVDFGKL